MARVCPWWYAFAFDNWFRRVLLRPEKMFEPYVRPGMTVLDVGCGMGVNAIALARMVGDQGRVIAVDLQQKMLDVLEKRAERAGVAQRISAHRCEPDSIGIDTEVGFAVAFWMLHEAPDAASFLGQVRSCLCPGGKLLVVEPRAHVSAEAFQEMLAAAKAAGLTLCGEPRIRLSRVAVLVRE